MSLRDLFILALAASGVASLASAQVPAGGEFRVNTDTALSQELWRGSVGLSASGAFAVVWDSGGTSVPKHIAGQRFDAAGTPQGAEFTLNSTPQFDRRVIPALAMIDRAGTFVAVWSSQYQDNFGYAVMGRYYNANGVPAGPEFPVNVYTPNAQWQPGIAADTRGNFVVVWTSAGQDGSGDAVIGRRYTRAGWSNEFQVNSSTVGQQNQAAVDFDAAGNFVVVWLGSQGFHPVTTGVFGQRFDASGQPRGAEFTVKDYGLASEWMPVVASGGDGRFVVAWEQNGTVGRTVLARRYDAAGAPLGGEFQVGVGTSGQYRPSIGADDIGNFVVAWWSDTDVWTRRFDANGAPLTGDVRVNTYTTSYQSFPNVAVDPVGNFVVAWESAYQDGDGNGVYAQRFGALLPAALRVDTGGNGILEPGETAVGVRPSWLNRNGAAQTFTGQIANPAGPAGGAPAITSSQATYGTLPNGVTGECASCYTISLPAPVPRPVVHWDATVDERLLPMALGQNKRWVLHVGDSFADVPRANPFYRFIETLLHRGVTGGCGATTYCPASSTARDQMAVFVLVAKDGAGYVPPACGTPVFNDVPASSPFCPWIEELARRGVVSGCGGGNYCPQAAVTREQMAVFVLRVLDPALNPSGCGTPAFGDVPASSPFCPWIEELARRGVVSGCGGGNYCPGAPVTREQMGVFLTVTFGLVLYGV